MDQIYQALQNASAERITIIAIAIVIFYFLPSIVAFLARRKNITRLFVLNLMTGWTFAAWLALLVWAVTGRRKDETDHKMVEANPGDA